MNAEGVTGQVFNVACNERISLNHMLKEITSQLGVELEPIYTEPRVGDVKHSLADISRAREALDYTPTVDFCDGIARTLEWFEQSGSHWIEATASKQ